MPTAWQPSALPPTAELETRVVLKKLPAAHRALAELKGLVAAIPNESLLLDTLPLHEAKDSSAIENIVTTQTNSSTPNSNWATRPRPRRCSATRRPCAWARRWSSSMGF